MSKTFQCLALMEHRETKVKEVIEASVQKMNTVSQKQNDQKMNKLPDDVWHTQGALIFYGIWRVDKN